MLVQGLSMHIKYLVLRACFDCSCIRTISLYSQSYCNPSPFSSSHPSTVTHSLLNPSYHTSSTFTSSHPSNLTLSLNTSPPHPLTTHLYPSLQVTPQPSLPHSSTLHPPTPLPPTSTLHPPTPLPPTSTLRPPTPLPPILTLHLQAPLHPPPLPQHFSSSPLTTYFHTSLPVTS